MRRLLWLSVLAACGCSATLREESSGRIGCPADQITITNDHMGMATHTWIATCGQRRFLCAAASSSDINCTPRP